MTYLEKIRKETKKKTKSSGAKSYVITSLQDYSSDVINLKADIKQEMLGSVYRDALKKDKIFAVLVSAGLVKVGSCS